MAGGEFFDRTEFVQYFRDETEELLQSIDAICCASKATSTPKAPDPEIVNSLFRALHTIKGSAGMLDFAAVQQIAHKLENVFDLLRKDRMPLTEGGINLLFEGRDVLTALVRAAIDGGEAPDDAKDFVERLDAFAGVYDETAQAIEGPRDGLDDEESLEPIDDARSPRFRPTSSGCWPRRRRRSPRSLPRDRRRRRAGCGRRVLEPQPGRQRARRSCRSARRRAPGRQSARRARRRHTIPSASQPRTKRSASTSSASTCCSTSSANWSSTAPASPTSRRRSAASSTPVPTAAPRRWPRISRSRRRCSRARPTRSKRAS
jgi:chemotaxis protein histidine kinase CheA